MNKGFVVLCELQKNVPRETKSLGLQNSLTQLTRWTRSSLHPRSPELYLYLLLSTQNSSFVRVLLLLVCGLGGLKYMSFVINALSFAVINALGDAATRSIQTHFNSELVYACVIIDALRTNASLESILALMEQTDFEIDYQEPQTLTTPLLAAIEHDREDIAVELVWRGASVELSDRFGDRPLTLACSRNLVATADALVQAGAGINCADGYKCTPLARAAFNGHHLLTQQCLLRGADPLLVDMDGDTPRTSAGLRVHGKVVKLLDAWGSIQAIWAVLSAGQLQRIGTRCQLKRLPKDLIRMVGSILLGVTE
jgi:ankyrin repeat protein